MSDRVRVGFRVRVRIKEGVGVTVKVGGRVRVSRAVASLTVLGGQELHFPHLSLKFQSIFLIFPQTLLIFFLILVVRVGESLTREALATLLRVRGREGVRIGIG